MSKTKCTFCKKLFLDVLKHEENCERQMDVIIGPDYEKVRCKLCKRDYYKDTVVKPHSHMCNGKRIYYDAKFINIYEHLRTHRIKENIEEHYEPIINIPIIDEEIVEKIVPGKPIPNHENYNITEEGDVYNKFGKKLKSICDKNGTGAYKIFLTTYGNKQSYMIHYLVALVYLENPNNLKRVRHKDGEKTNNYYENLEWC